MPNRIQVLSVKNPLLHILCKCYCFCLLLLETQLVQSVQLEKLAFFSFRALAFEMMRASDLLAVTNMYTHKP
uniref:Uncharacterized protein n=1 Tax=Chelydra serpentina TaxID=8475 RepID=A0A8C3TIG3_CHESE